MMNNVLHLISSNDTSLPYQNTIDDIVNLIESCCQNHSWTKVYIDAFVISGKILRHDAYYLTRHSNHSLTIDANLAERYKLDALFMTLYRQMKNNDGMPLWNKARLILKSSENNAALAHQWDNDYCWLTTLENHEKIREQIDPALEAKIMSWEGLPNNLPRTWKREVRECQNAAETYLTYGKNNNTK